MNTDNILKTAYGRKLANGSYAVGSLLVGFEGRGTLLQDAAHDFYTLYAQYKTSAAQTPVIPRTSGRPRKENQVNMHTLVQSETKDAIDRLASSYDLSQGEVMDLLLRFFQKNQPVLIKESVFSDIAADLADALQ